MKFSGLVLHPLARICVTTVLQHSSSKMIVSVKVVLTTFSISVF